MSPMRSSLCLLAALFFAGCSPAPRKPNGIILFIADGTSQELLTATRRYAFGAKGGLELEKFPHTAIVRTASASHLVTDSSAAATAMARGIKADNRVVGQAGPESTVGPPSILDLAKAAGWSTGVLSDDSVTGATPASFLVEHPNRDDHAGIAGKIISALGRRADLVLGGGTQWFSDVSGASYSEKDRAVVEKTRSALAASGAAVFDNWDDFLREAPAGRPILGTFFPKEFPYFADGERKPRLVDMVEAAVKVLQERKKPFLLIAEAGLPDKACHINSAKRAMTEVLEFDAALAWAASLPDVLVLATTDHNTGGLAFNGYPPIGYRGESLLKPNPVTGAMYLTWASGPGGNATANTPVEGDSETQKNFSDPGYAQPALISVASALHTGGDVWLVAKGPGSERASGYLENTDIFKILEDAIAGRASKSSEGMPTKP